MKYKPVEVGMRLRRMRKNSGYSREKVAEAIGRSVKYYADIERGVCGMSLETLLGLADFWHVSLDYLVQGEGEGENGIDEQTKWAVQSLYGMEEKRRKIAIEMVSLMVEQAKEYKG